MAPRSQRPSTDAAAAPDDATDATVGDATVGDDASAPMLPAQLAAKKTHIYNNIEIRECNK